MRKALVMRGCHGKKQNIIIFKLCLALHFMLSAVGFKLTFDQ
jgi:hypothetical protein